MQHPVSPESLAASRAFVEREHRLLIGGRWVEPVNGRALDVFNPADGSLLARVPAGDAADVELAVATARAAFESSAWRDMRPADRQALIWRLADLVEAHADELAVLETLDNGKPASFARGVDVAAGVDFLRYMAGWATKIEGSTVPVSAALPGKKLFAYTTRQPVGVVGAIVPWNFPLLMAIWKLGPALAAGCAVVLKPAEETPLSALRLGELVLEAGFPAGVVNIVTGFGHEAGAALSAHPGVDKVAFTGSTEIGKLVGKSALEHMARVSLELGGKSPVLVLEDADVAAAAQGAAQAIFFNQGQVCTAGSRLYVHESRFEAVVAALSSIAAGLTLGDGLNPATQMGPLVSARQQERVEGYIRQGVASGATLAAGGRAWDGAGYFVRPTVLALPPQDASVVQEEIFGPVVVVRPFSDLDEAVRLANDTPYGLAASVWSNDLSAVHRLVPRLAAGTVWVNTHNMLDPALPFGGFKQSGIGREMGREVIEHYTETQSVMMAL